MAPAAPPAPEAAARPRAHRRPGEAAERGQGADAVGRRRRPARLSGNPRPGRAHQRPGRLISQRPRHHRRPQPAQHDSRLRLQAVAEDRSAGGVRHPVGGSDLPLGRVARRLEDRPHRHRPGRDAPPQGRRPDRCRQCRRRPRPGGRCRTAQRPRPRQGHCAGQGRTPHTQSRKCSRRCRSWT